jgi:ABC-type nitrate/sulfonate/bicarbonate transport system substrate-binding protein
MRSPKSTRGGALAALLLAAACAAPGASPGAPAPAAGAPAAGSGAPATAPTVPPLVSLRTAYTTTTPSMASLWAAKDGGYFERYGIDADVTFLRAGSEVLGAVASGEIPLALGGGFEFMAAALEGSDHVMLGGTQGTLTVSLYAAPSVRSVADLRGQAVGVSRFGAITHFGALKILERNGLRAGDDVAIIQTGGVPESLAAMQSGAAQAAILTPPNMLHARQLGFALLVDTAPLNIPNQGSVIASTRGFVRDQPALAERYMAALIEGLHRYLTDREFGIITIGRYTRTDDRDILAESYDYYDGTMERDLTPSMPGLQAQLDELASTKPQAQSARPEQFLDLGPLDRVKASGLVERLYAP